MIYISLETNPDKKIKYGCLISSVALTNQHTSVIYVLFYALHEVKYVLKLIFTEIQKIRLIFCFLAVPFIFIYAYIPLSAILNPDAVFFWGDGKTISGFLTHVLRREYGTFDLAKGGTVDFFANVIYCIRHMKSDFSLSGLIVIGISIFSKKRGSILKIFLPAFIYLVFFSSRANFLIFLRSFTSFFGSFRIFLDQSKIF